MSTVDFLFYFLFKLIIQSTNYSPLVILPSQSPYRVTAPPRGASFKLIAE